MSYPTFVGNEQNDEELYYDVPTDFFETMQKFMAFNSGLTTKEYVEMIDFYNSYSGWSYNKPFNGVLGFLENKLKRSDLWQREELGKYLTKFKCEECGGSRLKKEALSIKINKCDMQINALVGKFLVGEDV